jgi:sulfite reductase alpha subunit-like flavoprotein
MSTSNNKKQQHVYVLYGSQTGNSEQAAEDFCRQLQDKFNTNNDDDFWQQQHSLQPPPHQNAMVTTTCMQLDDFLEVKQAKFDGHCMIIFVSSYGVGQAPLGAYRFRSLAEELLRQPKKDGQYDDDGGRRRIYQGLHYAVCGLGDSTYPTYLKNPTTIDEALSKAGATRLQAMGKADAHQIGGDQSQDKVIQQWIDDLWVPLAKALTAEAEESTTIMMDAAKMQQDTLQILQRLDPDFVVKEEKMTSNAKNAGGSKLTLYIVVGIAVALLAILVGNWNNYKLSLMHF